jgi:CRP-like cAMP-binding protein
MSKTQSVPAARGNQLLARLPADEFHRLFPDPRPVALEFKHVLYEPRALIDFAYFPSIGVVSQVTLMENGAVIELSTVGNEGMIGLPISLGIAESSSKAVVQVAGRALRLPAARLKDEVSRDTPLRTLLLRYAGVFLFQISQGVACNGLHSVHQRCCRWLLMTHDRVEGDEFPITHEFLAQMLGVRRPSITDVLQPLQKEGLLRYHRGRMVVLNRQGLEDSSCECYRTVKREFAQILGVH